jgi:2-aminoadipate transaminase
MASALCPDILRFSNTITGGELERVVLARRAAALSPILASGGHAPGIAFDSGHGFPGVFPDLTAAAERALNEHRAESLQYGGRPGLPDLRSWIAGYMAESGADVTTDDILIVNGAKHGIELVCRTLLDPGDAIVVTAPTYFTAIPLFRSFEVDFIEIGQDVEGLDTDELAASLDRWRREGRKPPKFIYNVPEFHNPTGLSMPRRRREALLEIARRHGIWVIEDSPYRELRYEGAAEPSLLALDDQKGVIHLGTFSKLIAPGLRIGWIAAPIEMIARMAQLKSDGGSSPLLQRIIFEWLRTDALPAHTQHARRIYNRHRDCMIEALRREMPEVSFHPPQGGYYVWLRLPGGANAEEFGRKAAASGVSIIAGSKFYAGGGIGYPRNEGPPQDRVRLTYSFATEVEIEEGVRRLGGVLRSMGV